MENFKDKNRCWLEKERWKKWIIVWTENENVENENNIISFSTFFHELDLFLENIFRENKNVPPNRFLPENKKWKQKTGRENDTERGLSFPIY